MTFAFRGHTRVIARAVVDAMVPRWPDFELDLTDTVLDGVERLIGGQPPAIQGLAVAGLWFFELGSFVFEPFPQAPIPLSRLDRDGCERRLTCIAHHPVANIRRMVLLYQTFVNLCAYGLPEVEEYLGAHRRAWRADRLRFRELLVQLDEGRALPPVPLPLADPSWVPAGTYLEPGVVPQRPAVSVPPARTRGKPNEGENRVTPMPEAESKPKRTTRARRSSP
jgi:hypothetical protein